MFMMFRAAAAQRPLRFTAALQSVTTNQQRHQHSSTLLQNLLVSTTTVCHQTPLQPLFGRPLQHAQIISQPTAASVAFVALRPLTTTTATTTSANMASKKQTPTAFAGRPQTFVQEINANLHLITERPRNVAHDPQTLRLLEPLPANRPLVIMPAWLLAKRKPLNKYAEIYLPLGFDVLTVTISPWQLLWPAKGTQHVARALTQFLHHNAAFSPLLVHGFSVGAYVWGECLVHMAADWPRYAPIVARIRGQVWDSAADITEIPVGVPKAVFPNHPRLNAALSAYMHYHLRTFYAVATQHYEKSSAQFHQNLVRAPALMFVSEDDPVGSVASNAAVRRDWERLGIECGWKCWQRSEHVSHFARHRDEYLEELLGHLRRWELVAGAAGGGVVEEVQDGRPPLVEEELPKLRAKL